MASRVAFPGTINSGDAVGATNNNNLPGGLIGRVTVTSDSTGTGTLESIAAVTVTANTSRELSITVTGTLTGSALTGGQVRIDADGTQIERKNFSIRGATADDQYSFTVVVHHRPSAGSHTYTFYTGVSGTSGATVTNRASATSPSSIFVRDEAPTF